MRVYKLDHLLVPFCKHEVSFDLLLLTLQQSWACSERSVVTRPRASARAAGRTHASSIHVHVAEQREQQQRTEAKFSTVELAYMYGT